MKHWLNAKCSGNIVNVNPVWLCSKSKQEIGDGLYNPPKSGCVKNKLDINFTFPRWMCEFSAVYPGRCNFVKWIN